MKRLTLIATFFIFFIPNILLAGTAYYVDPNAPNGGNGTFEQPWNSIAQVNAKKFANGDDVYFKVGTTMAVTTNMNVRWSGTPNDPVIIGAYYGKNQFGLNGSARPILRGNQDEKNPVPDNPYNGIIDCVGSGYVTVRDLHIKDSRAGGIFMKGQVPPNRDPSIYNSIINNIIENSGRQGIVLGRCSYGLVENNVIDTTSTVKELLAAGVWAHGGAGLEVTGMNKPDEPYVYNTVRGNTLRYCHESLGIYGGARYTTVENNIIYETSQVAIYATNSRNGVIRNNLVYNPDPQKSKHWRQPDGRRNGIWIDCEGHVASTIKAIGEWKVDNNYVAGFANGIWLNNASSDIEGIYQKNNKIHDNIIVDCDRNILVSKAGVGWEGNEIYNNYSFIFTSGLDHVVGVNAAGVTWYNNHYNTAMVPAPGGNARNEAIIDDIKLIKTAGWRDLPIDGTVSAALFSLESGSSKSVQGVANLRAR